MKVVRVKKMVFKAKRACFLASILLFVWLVQLLIKQQRKIRKQTPNIIIMLMDDMGWGDLGVNGDVNRETPNIDRMAMEGAMFTDFYAAAPTCSPSRAALLTGRLPPRNGIYTDNNRGRNSFTAPNVIGGISDEEVLISEVLKQKGYRNMIIGKWHLGNLHQHHPLKHGFDEYFGSPSCHWSLQPQGPVYKNENMIGRYFEDYPITKDGESNMTQLFTQEAISFIERQADSGQPFFLYWTPDAHHNPHYASRKYLNSSKRGKYGAVMREIDDSVGKILETLRRKEISDNTLVFFASDNGPPTHRGGQGINNGPFRCGKHTTFEGGVRTPMIAWGPGIIPSGLVSYQVGMLTDIFPTILDLLSISLDTNPTLDGISLLPALLKNKISDRSIFLYRGNLLMAVRKGRYKLHLWTWNTPEDKKRGHNFCFAQEIPNITTTKQTERKDPPLLYDLAMDQPESFPLRMNNETRPIVSELRNIADQHLKDMVWADAQNNFCDESQMYYSPPGCEYSNKCLNPPSPQKHLCDWYF